jgi:NAD(P)-dependent dehydrogenase (short-subunit alcohol dehydrogenase family)
MGLLDGHRAAVTGGGSGIGRATCRRMVAEGARVAVLDVDGDAAETVAKEIDGLAYQLDVIDYERVEVVLGDVTAKLGGLSLLFNNAGTTSMSNVHAYALDEWHRVLGVNLTGVFHGFKAGIPLILATGGGSVVTTASISGTRPAAGEAPYSVSKAAVAALTANAALEYAPAVRVNSVSPGMIHTGLTDILLTGFPDLTEKLVEKTPLGRIGAPEDIADVVVFLCSDQARFITGQNLVIDGGMTLHGGAVDGLFDAFFGSGGTAPNA